MASLIMQTGLPCNGAAPCGLRRSRVLACCISTTMLLLGLFAAGPAIAGWRYTNWAMTPEEVVTASQGKAAMLEEPDVTRSGLVRSAKADYRAGALSFHVSFLFHPATNVLERVVLKLKNAGGAPHLYQDLESHYGEPQSSEIKPIQGGERHTAEWLDVESNNRITYFGVGDYYAIEYAPISRAMNGL